jgi:hypothetical protein
MVTSRYRGLECPSAIILSDTYFMATADYFEVLDSLCNLVGSDGDLASARAHANRMHVKMPNSSFCFGEAPGKTWLFHCLVSIGVRGSCGVSFGAGQPEVRDRSS